MEGHLLMSRKELYRKTILEMVQNGHITLLEASHRLKLSYRQTLRVYHRFRSEGDQGLVHRGRGRCSNRAYPDSFRKKVISRYKQRYRRYDLGPTLAAEKMAEDGLVIDHETLRRWLLAEGLWKKRRRRKIHRSRRQRHHHFGDLVQLDGSHHCWFGQDRPQACLMNMVDDATSTTMARMDEQETTVAAMFLLRRWIEKYGIPKALYTDKKNVFVTDRTPTIKEQLAGIEPKTAFAVACDKLGIEIITAHSPQAKGRVERSNGTYQDRLVKELALRRIKTCATADKLLRTTFCDHLNDKFAVTAPRPQDHHHPVPKGLNLEDVFCFDHERTIRNDWTISFQNRHFQIHRDNNPLPQPREKVTVRIRLDGSMDVIYKDRNITFTEIQIRELRLEARRRQAKCPPARVAAASQPQKARKPAANHPWKTERAVRKSCRT
jgi:transposase-like protein